MNTSTARPRPYGDTSADGTSRRRFLAGLGCVSAAAMVGPLVSTRAALATTPQSAKDTKTLVVVFMRGGVDGLRILAPTTAGLGRDDLSRARPDLASMPITALSGSQGWGLNSAAAPLVKHWNANKLAFVPAVSVPNLSRSHFSAQRLLETGGVATSSSGWLNRALENLGNGDNTFRALSDGGTQPLNITGPTPVLALSSLDDFQFAKSWGSDAANKAALQAMYKWAEPRIRDDVNEALDSLTTANGVSANRSNLTSGAYGADNFGTAMRDVAAMIKSNLGVQVATIDVNGWDTHTNQVARFDPLLSSTAKTLDAFMSDLGSLRDNVTVVLMSEFGRRVAQNGTGGSDHGHGSLMWVLGGAVRRSGVYGGWNGVAPAALDDGDVPFTNNAFDVLGDVAGTWFGGGSVSTMFPGHHFRSTGVAG